MHTHNLKPWLHSHKFAAVDRGNERRTTIVVGLTAATMVVEIVAGLLYNSMALLADGWHMGTHVAALTISVFAYRYARRHAEDARFTFGTGKVGVLSGFSSAVVLAVVALLMAAESVQRFFSRPDIRFDQAILVAMLGLAVNLISAVILRRHSAHQHHGGPHHTHVHDHNLKAAYLHVVADTLTSVLAIVALVFGKFLGYVWLDPLMGLVGGFMIARWSYGLLRDTGHILLDSVVSQEMLQAVRSAIESDADNRISDLHLWRVGPDDYATIVSVVSDQPRTPEHYKGLLSHIEGLSHITVEVHRCRPQQP